MMALDVQQESETKVTINKSLINNKFESYKLKFDHILAPISNTTDEITESKDDPSSTTSQSINTPHPHQPIQIQKRISNLARLQHLIDRNYIFSIEDHLFYYDTSGIFMVDTNPLSIHKIYSFPKNSNTLNLSVTGCLHHDEMDDSKSPTFYFIFSYSDDGLSMLQFNASTKSINVLFNDAIKDIPSGFIVENGYYSPSQKRVFVDIINWNQNEHQKTFHPMLYILEFGSFGDEQSMTYKVHSELKGAKEYYQSFFDQKKETFWVISRGGFWCKESGPKNEDESNGTESMDQNEKSHSRSIRDIDCLMIECFNITTMESVSLFHFKDCSASKLMSIDRVGINLNVNDKVDRVLCVIGCELSYDMAVFCVMDQGKGGYSVEHKASFPGLAMIAEGKKHKKRIMIEQGLRNLFIVEHQKFISSFMNPGDEIKGIQDSLELEHDESFEGTLIRGNELYCLTNYGFYQFHLPQVEV